MLKETRGCTFYFATTDWSRRLAPPPQSVRCKAKSSRDLIVGVSSSFMLVKSVQFALSLACCIVYLCSDWPMCTLVFFFETQLKKRRKVHSFLLYRFTLSTDGPSIAALICAFYPRFPISSTDNRQVKNTISTGKCLRD